jgi:hypothetical protein
MVNGRLERESNPPTGQLASPVPQYKIPGEDNYEKLEGQHGASFTKIKDAEGTVVSPATEAQLEQVKNELALVKAELQAIKTNQTSGDQKVQQVGTIATLYSMNFADRPLYTEITEPTVFVLMNSSMDMWWTDGSADWVVI